jgi:hypothetical protein
MTWLPLCTEFGRHGSTALSNFMNREIREIREESRPFPQSGLRFAYFAYFAVPSTFNIGMIEFLILRVILMFSFVERGFGM